MRIACLSAACLIGFASLPALGGGLGLQSIVLESVYSEQSSSQVDITLSPWQWDLVEIHSDSSLSIFASPWIRWGSENEFSGAITFRPEELPVLDFREAYLEFDLEAADIQIGRKVLDLGYNLLINPADSSPLSFADPVHPDRLGRWGAHLEVQEAFGTSLFLTQGPLFVTDGPRRLLSSDLSLGDYSYGQDLGGVLYYTIENPGYRLQYSQTFDIHESGIITPDENIPTQVDVEFESAFSTALALEFLFNGFNLRHEVRYQVPENSSDYLWGVLELDRTFFLGMDRRELTIIPFWAYTAGADEFHPYDRLRRNAIGVHLSLGLTFDKRFSLLQEWVSGTEADDLYLRSALRISPSAGKWVECFYEYRDLIDAPFDENHLVGIQYTQWFR